MTDNNIVFFFPGQGAQKVGMLSEFYSFFDCFKSLFDDIQKWTGIDIRKIVYEDNDLINKTLYTQLSVLTVELGLLRILKEKGIEPTIMLGYSLGEYACLVCSGILSEEDAIKLIVKRAEAMENACPARFGAMAAVIGMEWNKIQEVIDDFENVWIANYNTTSLVSIAGEKNQIEKCSSALSQAGARRVIPINVSGPFHTPLLKSAGDEFAKSLLQVEFKQPKIPYYSNFTGKIVDSNSDIKMLLFNQIFSPVKWCQSIKDVIESGHNRFVEVGPGKVLRGFMKDYPGVETYGLENITDLDKFTSAILG